MNSHKPAQLLTLDGEPVMLEGLRLTGALKGLLFEAAVEQRFKNPTDRHVEVAYTFPLPYGAVLLDISVRLGDQELTGSVVEKKQAEAKYEDALSEGDAAIMLERNQDGTHSLNLGNLAAGESCIITLHYAQTLAFEQNGIRLLIPTVIAPRYGNPMTDGGLSPHQVTEHDLAVEYPFELSIDIEGDLSRSHVSSPSHPVGVNLADMESARRVRVSLASQSYLDRDFILCLDQLPVNSMGVVAPDSVHPQHRAALISICPTLKTEIAPHIAVKLLVDCSGSMSGDSIAASRRALQAVIQQLAEGDRFSLSKFGDGVDHRSRGLWSVKPSTRLSAQRWIGNLDANMGGTEMEAALHSTFTMGHGVTSDVLLITDGEIYAIDSLLKTASESGQRIFVVGIGSSPSEANLRRLAEVTGGACDFVAAGENVEPTILRMFARLRSPKVEALQLVWPEGITPIWQSELPKSVFDADTVNVFALFEGSVQGDLALWGSQAMESAHECLGYVALGGEISDTDTVARMAASVRLKGLDKDEASALAVAYQLITDQTNYLLIHERAEDEKAQDMPELIKVKQMLPAGWGGTGSVSSNTGPKLCLIQTYTPGMDYAAMERPVVKRSQSSSHTTSEKDVQLEYLDIPAFLRRQADPDEDKARAKKIQYQSRNAQGFVTPAGLLNYLNQHPHHEWPKTYAALRKLGLSSELVEWLEHIFASEYLTEQPENRVVESFLRALMSTKTSAAIKMDRSLIQTVKLKLEQLFKTDKVSQAETTLVSDLEAYMEGITPEAWPKIMEAVVDTIS